MILVLPIVVGMLTRELENREGVGKGKARRLAMINSTRATSVLTDIYVAALGGNPANESTANDAVRSAVTSFVDDLLKVVD